jgi:glutathione S-transferase
MNPYSAAALITLLNVLLLVIAVMLVGRARGKYQVKAPATTGHPEFELAFRAQQNTLEATVMFLPCLWLATMYGDARIAGWLGYAWVAARFWYLFAYARPGGNRSPGFTIGALANLVLLGMAFWGLLPPLLRIG